MSYTDEDARRWSERVKIWDTSIAADGYTSAAQHTPEEVVRQVADAIEAEGRLLPLEAETRKLIKLLFALYVAWNEADVYDPGHELTVDGVKVTGIASLLGAEGALDIEQAWEAIEPHENQIRQLIEGVSDGG